eukprot:Ihof_evm7s33 gene=Ihof_evmTU7s33
MTGKKGKSQREKIIEDKDPIKDIAIGPLLISLVTATNEALDLLDRGGLSVEDHFEAWNTIGSSFIGIGPYIQSQKEMLAPLLKVVKDHIKVTNYSNWPCYSMGDILLVASYIDVSPTSYYHMESRMVQACVDELADQPIEMRTILMLSVPTTAMCQLNLPGSRSFTESAIRRIIGHQTEEGGVEDDYDYLLRQENATRSGDYPTVHSDYVTSHAFMALVACKVDRRIVLEVARSMVRMLPKQMELENV